VTLFYGPQFHDAIQVLRIVSLLPITIGISNLLGFHTMLNLRMDGAFFGITLTGSVIGLLLNTLFIQQMGYVGAAYAWVGTESFIALAMYTYLSAKGIQVIQRAYLREAVVFSRTRLATLFK
jgi:PST family polysaccharide transporter